MECFEKKSDYCFKSDFDSKNRMGMAPGGHGGCTGSREPSLEREFDAESDSVKNLGDLVRGETPPPKPHFVQSRASPLHSLEYS